ncbi:MAG: maleylpyruvate isomerase N-terminal domain-containing protein [Pseudoclavibacter sp.]|nr:maleylpyruvate isomerase N-terminal domain-containing protein [Pseudoclavibacter sp.]
MDARTWFETATEGFLALLPGLAGRLDDPGPGEWDVRSLLGRACRAFTTVEEYLTASGDGGPEELDSPRAYYLAASGSLADPAHVRRRGIETGRELGAEPLTAAHVIARRVVDTVRETPDEAVLATPLGPMRLSGYLPTRAFELTVHSLDLARATAQSEPPGLVAARAPALHLSLDLATPEQQRLLLLACTGRESLSFSSTPI